MEDHDVALARVAARQHGLVTASQAHLAGASARAVHVRVERGLLVPVHRGVYRHAAGEDSRWTTLLAACLACGPAAVASHRSAGRLWDLRGVPRWRPEVTVPGTRLPRVHEAVVHRTDRLDPEDVTAVQGVPVTSVARTLLDLGALLHVDPLRSAAEDAVLRSLVSPLDLLCTLERLGGRGRRGTRRLRAVVTGLLPLPAALESRLEAALLRIVRESGAPPPPMQYDAVVAGGRRVRFDFAWPALRIAVEADGRRWHATSADFERDLARHNAVTAAGWRLYRYGWADVHQRRERTRAELAAALRQVGAA